MAAVKTKKSTSANPYLSVILPVFNEEESLTLQYKAVSDAVKKLKKTYEIIFVDDGSSDSSYDILKEIASSDKNVRLVRFRRNFGQTAAMAAGIDYSKGEVIVFMDSDLQNEPEDIGKLLEKIDEGYDVVSGWRANRQDKLISRKIPSKIANWLIARVTGVPLHDLGCSLKAYRGEVLRQVNLYGEMHRFIPVHASWIGARITEVPVGHHARQFGKSKYGIKRTFKVLLDLITVKFMGSYSTKPIYIFGGTGIFLLLLGFLSGAAVVAMKILLHHNMIRNPLLLMTVMLIILGVLFIQMGIIAEIMIRIYHESQKLPPYRVRETVNIE
ncbi:MAG TPA: glycosyltransferase family 2 protein [Spirochaetota bacterium]|jgi:glycosyltransferase involved in cell wall biosynthesis|nr:glycosyltransferase family 2 protein [Spirochaetota bacterium]HOQ12712.1 glycosyltransferase family 2 protein [Spirochaetota bacterium]HOV08323.1 glycosyltransferase family 2 protein [Spirochaetota bacterium]